jgi:hypothetical protein
MFRCSRPGQRDEEITGARMRDRLLSLLTVMNVLAGDTLYFQRLDGLE